MHQIPNLKESLAGLTGHLCLEYTISRMGRRIDAVIIDGPVIYVVEFKIGESEVNRGDLDQVCDYALDLQNFHGPSHHRFLVPILIPSNAGFFYGLVLRCCDWGQPS